MPTGIRNKALEYVACSADNKLSNDCKSNLQSSAIYGAPGPLGINFFWFSNTSKTVILHSTDYIIIKKIK